MIGEPLVGCWCKYTVYIICLSGIKICAFSNVPPVSDSAEEETTFLRVLYSVKIVPFGVVVTL